MILTRILKFNFSSKICQLKEGNCTPFRKSQCNSIMIAKSLTRQLQSQNTFKEIAYSWISRELDDHAFLLLHDLRF